MNSRNVSNTRWTFLLPLSALALTLLSGCDLSVSGKVPTTTTFVYPPVQACARTDVTLKPLQGDVGVSLTQTLSRETKVSSIGEFFVNFADGTNHQVSDAKTSTFEVHCEGSAAPPASVQVTTPALDLSTSSQYRGHTVTVQDDSAQPSGFRLTVTMN
jgi:hypothetical protein